MNWLHFSLITIVLYGVHDILLKQLSEAVDSTAASLCINGSAALVLAVYLLLQSTGKTRLGNAALSTDMIYLVLAGVSLGIATITFMNAFNRGGNLSIAVPVVYAGVIGICMLFGVIFFKEKLNWQQIIGALFAVAGIYLMSRNQVGH